MGGLLKRNDGAGNVNRAETGNKMPGRSTRGAVADVLNTGKRKAIAAVAMIAVVACVAGGAVLALANDDHEHSDASIDSFYTSGLHLDSHAGPDLYRAKTGNDFSVAVTTEDARTDSFESALFDHTGSGGRESGQALFYDKDFWRAGDKQTRNEWMKDITCQSIWFKDFEAARNAEIVVDYPYIGDYNAREVGAKVTITKIVPYLRSATAATQREYDNELINNNGEVSQATQDRYNTTLMQPAIQIADQMNRGIYYENIHSMDIQIKFYYIDNEDNRAANLADKPLQSENGGSVNDIYLTMSSLSLWKDGPLFVSEKVKPLSSVSKSFVLLNDDAGNQTHIYKKLSDADSGMYSTSYNQYYPLLAGTDADGAQVRLEAYGNATANNGMNFTVDTSDSGWYSPYRMWGSYNDDGSLGEWFGNSTYVDTVGHHTFPRQAASMLFADGNDVQFGVSSTGNTMWFTIYPAGLTNMAPRSPILTDNSKPHKAIFSDDGQPHYPENAGFGAGAEVKYVVEQEVNTLNANSIVRYDNLALEDKVPDAVEISNYYITRATVSIDPTTHEEVISDEQVIATKDDLRNVGTFSRWSYGNATWVEATDAQRAHWSNTATQDSNGNVVRFEFDYDYLQNDMLMEGEHYFLHIDGKVKADAAVGTELFNAGAVYINNANYDTTKPDNYHPTNVLKEEVVSELSHQEITLNNRNETFTYAISQLVPEDADRLYVLDTLEDVFEVVGEPRLVYVEGEGDNRTLKDVDGAIFSVTPANVSAHDGQSQKVEATLEDVVSDGGRTVIPRVTNVHGKSLTLMFDVKLRDGLTDEDLLAYSRGKQVSTYSTTISQDYDDEVSTGKIPNIAKVNFTHDPDGGSDTNIVNVNPPFGPEKAIVKDADSSGQNYDKNHSASNRAYIGDGKGVHLDTAKPTEEWTYYISQAIPAGVSKVALTDPLDSRLERVDDTVQVYLNDITGTPVRSLTWDNNSTVTLDNAEAYAGGTLIFGFRVKFKSVATQDDIDAIVKAYQSVDEGNDYKHVGILNKATVTLDSGTPRDTNEVTVTTSASKDVNAVDAGQASRGGEHHAVANRDDLFQYGVEYFASGNTTSLSMTDTLEPVLEMAEPRNDHARVFVRDVQNQGEDGAAFGQWTALDPTDYSVSVTNTQDGAQQIVHVGIVPASIGKVANKQVRFEFDTKIRAAATDAQLDAYLKRDTEIPNTAIVFMNGEPRVTNEVGVTPPPEKDVYALDGAGTIDKTRGNSDNTHLDLLKRGEVYRYTITERFDGDAKDVSITDILEHVLEFADGNGTFGNLSIVAVSQDADGNLIPALLKQGTGKDYTLETESGQDSKQQDSSGFKVSFNDTGADGVSVVAGKRVTVSFDVRVKNGADLSGYEYSQIPNDAVVKVGNDPEVRTNKVTVTPPPEKKVYTLNGANNDEVSVRTGDGAQDTDEHAYTKYQTEQVVYRISGVVPQNATKFEMADTLNYLMELGEGNNGGLEAYWMDGDTKKPVTWSISYSYPEVDFGTAAKPNKQQTTRIHVNVTDDLQQLAGKELVFEFKARLKAGLTENDLKPYLNEATGKADVPNTAEVDLGNGPRVTNEVLVTPPGRQDLRISKQVTQSVADETFEFRVKFFDVRGHEMTDPGYIFDYDVVPTAKANGYTATDVLASGRVGSGDTLKLKAGQTAVIKDVYVYVRYQVEELENSYYQQKSVTVDPNNVEGAGAGEGRIAADRPSTVTFTNEPKGGSLRIKKVVARVPEGEDPTFNLDVYLKSAGAPFAGDVAYTIRDDEGDTRGVATFAAVTAEQVSSTAADNTAGMVVDASGANSAASYGWHRFELKPNQTIIFGNLPAGMEYQVWEADTSDKWINATRENNVGAIQAGDNTSVAITNEYKDEPGKTVNGRTDVVLEQRDEPFEYKVSYWVPDNPFSQDLWKNADGTDAAIPDSVTYEFTDQLEECLDLVGRYNNADIVWPANTGDTAEEHLLQYYLSLNYDAHGTAAEGNPNRFVPGYSADVREDGGRVTVSAKFTINKDDLTDKYSKSAEAAGHLVTLTFRAKIKDGYADSKLMEKYGGTTTVPNTGVIVLTGGDVTQRHVTNEVHVTPPPTKSVDAGSPDTDDAKTNAILSVRDKVFTYTIGQSVPANARSVMFEDTLKDVLEAVRTDGDAVYRFEQEYAELAKDAEGNPANPGEFLNLMMKYVTVTATWADGSATHEARVVPAGTAKETGKEYIEMDVNSVADDDFSITVTNQKLTMYVSGRNAEALRDKHVTVSFDAKIRDTATEHQLHTYVNNEIPNNARVTINGQPLTTNDVWVVPAPFKEITTGDTDTNEDKTHANLSEADKVFTYEVKDKVPTMATKVVMEDTLDDLLEFYPGTGERTDYANVKVELHNNAVAGEYLEADDYTVSYSGQTIRITLTPSGLEKVKHVQDLTTDQYISYGSEIDFVFQAKVRPLDKMSAKDLAKLHAYEASKGGIPNTGSVDFGRGPRVTNEVTVVPPPEKKIEVSAASGDASASTAPTTSLVDFLTLQARDQVHTYRVMDSIPANAAGVSFDDDLESALELVMGDDALKGVKVYAFDYTENKTEPEESDLLDISKFVAEKNSINDGDIHLEFKDNGTGDEAKSVVAGKTVVVKFDAKIRESTTTGELERYVVRDGGVPNDATFSIGNTHRTTNTVVVVPPPRKLVDGELSEVLQNADQDFTYTVTDVIRTDGHDVVMTDVLEELLEPSTVDGVADGGLSVEMSSAGFAKGEVKVDGVQQSVGAANADYTVEIDHGTVDDEGKFTKAADGNRIRVKVTMADTGEGDAKRSVAAGHAITFSFKARIKSTDGMTEQQRKDFDATLRDYITEESGVPNTATVQVNGHDPRVTNKVTVVPQPEKKVTKQGNVDSDGNNVLMEHENLETKTQPFTYTIIHTVGADAEDVVFTDELDPVLELLMLERDEASTSISDVVRARVERGSVSAPEIDAAKSTITTANGRQKLTVAFRQGADGASTAAGKTVILEFRARIKADANLRPYLENLIENQGLYEIDGTDQWTNKVTVTPPPEKKVNPHIDGKDDATLEKYDWTHYHLKHEGEAFTYSVSDRLPSNATGVVMEDTLEHVLELARTQNGQVVTFSEQGKDLSDAQKAELLKDYVTVEQDGLPIAENHYTVELLPATTEAGEATTMLRVTVLDNRVSLDDPSQRVSHLAGHVAKFDFQAVIKEGADATPFLTKEEGESGEGVPNKATVKIAGTPRVTNEVSVVPTPVKKVTRDGNVDADGNNVLLDHENLEAMSQPFTYTVTDAFSGHATKVSLTDTLEPVLELLKNDDKYDVTVTSTDESGSATELSYDSGTGEYSASDTGKKFRVGVADENGRQTLTIWVTDDAVHNAKVSFAFKARIKDGVTDDELEPYRQAGNLIPNTATVAINGDSRASNEVTVTPPPEKLVQGGTHYRVLNEGAPFTFSVTDYLPGNAVDVTMTDELKPEFSFYPGEGGGNISKANVKVTANGRQLSANDFDVELNGQEIKVHVKTRAYPDGSTLSRVAGQRVTFRFDATIDPDADVAQYDAVEGQVGVPNDATVSVKAEGQPKVDRTTNKVTVTPPPTKPQKGVGPQDSDATDESYTLPTKDTVFKYSVKQKVPADAVNVRIADPLNDLLVYVPGSVAVDGLDTDDYTVDYPQDASGLDWVDGSSQNTLLVKVKGEDGQVDTAAKSKVAGKTITLTFNAKVKDNLTDDEKDQLEAYVRNAGIPNTATVAIGDDPQETNTVHVIPPTDPMKTILAVDGSGDGKHLDLENADDEFVYTVTRPIPGNATEVSFSDTLDDTLLFASDAAVTAVAGNVTVGLSERPAPVSGKTLEFSLTDDELADARGKVLTVSFRAAYDPDKVAEAAASFVDVDANGRKLEGAHDAADADHSGTPNTAVLSIDGDNKGTVTVTVTPPPVKKIVKGEGSAAELVDSLDLDTRNQVFTYRVSDTLPANATNVVIADPLDDLLEYVVNSAKVDGLGAGDYRVMQYPAKPADLAGLDAVPGANENMLVVQVEDADGGFDASKVSKAAGKTITLSFNAKVKDNLSPEQMTKLAEYVKAGGVTNTAAVNIGSDPVVSRATNEVTVTPPPTEVAPVKTITRTDGTGGTEHLDLTAADEAFTYTVTQEVPQDAYSLVFTDTLDDYLVFDGAVGVTATDADGQNPVELSGYTVKNGKTLTFTLNEDDLKKARGHNLVVKFNAKYDSDKISGALASYVDVDANGQKLEDDYDEDDVAHTGTPNQATVAVNGTERHTAVVTVVPPADTPMDVPGTLVVKAKKTFTGRDVAPADVFAFDLAYGDNVDGDNTDGDNTDGDTVVATAYLHGEDFADGVAEVEFPTVTFDADGVHLGGTVLAADSLGDHSFTVTERDLGVNGITYDTDPRTVDVTVTKSDQNVYQLNVTATGKGGGAGTSVDAASNVTTANVGTFANTYKPDYTPARVSLNLTKELDGADISEYPGEFTFELKGVNGTVLEGGPYTATNDAFGSVVFPSPLKYEFDEDEEYPREYTYEVAERQGTDGHVSYATSPIAITVVVSKDDETNQLVASVSSDAAAEAVGIATSNGETIAEGNELIGESAVNVGTITNEWTDPDPVTVDVTAKKVYKNVKDGSKAQLKAGEFEFELVDPDGKVVAWETEPGTTVDFAANTAEGDVLFPVPSLEFTYDDVKDAPGKTKTFHYSIREKHKVFGSDDEVAYADERPFTVTVSDNAQTGQLDVTKSDAAAFAFTNWKLEPGSTKIDLKAVKALKDSRMGQAVDFDANEFRFKVSGGLVRAEDGMVSQLAGAPWYAYNQADGSVVFDELPLTQAGTYEFTVEEDVAEDDRDPNIAYDSTKHTVVVVVEEAAGAAGEADEDASADTADGADGAAADGRGIAGDEGEAAGEERKAEPNDAARRLIEELAAEDDDEAAVVEGPAASGADSDGGVDAPTGSEADAALNPQVAAAYFDVADGGKLARTAADDVAGAEGEATAADSDRSGLTTQAATEHHLKVVKVTVDGEDVSYADGAAVSVGTFENEYVEPDPATAVIRATKQLDGAAPAAGKTFDFKLEPIKGAPLPAGGVDTAANNGAAIEFPAITYTQVGAYLYRLTEVDGGKVVDGIHHDAAVYNVVVSVANVNGSLQATVEYLGDADPVFKNTTENPDPGVGQLEISKMLVNESAGGLGSGQAFNFRVTLVGADGKALAGEYAYDGSSTGTVKPDAKGTAVVQLKAGEAVTLKGLPAGAKYVVEEVDIPEGYALQSKAGDIGSIEKDATGHAKFVNAPKAAAKGSLVLSKTVTGTTNDDVTPFQFKVVLKDSNGADLADSFAYSGSASGTMKSGDILRLRNGDALAITGLPEGAAYTVEEVAIPKGYELKTSSGTTGVIAEKAKVSTASFVNAKTTASTAKKTVASASTRTPTVTKTGATSTGGKPLSQTGDSNMMVALVLAGVALVAGGVVIAAKRRRDSNKE